MFAPSKLSNELSSKLRQVPLAAIEPFPGRELCDGLNFLLVCVASQ
jgi:hypothetical protein